MLSSRARRRVALFVTTSATAGLIGGGNAPAAPIGGAGTRVQRVANLLDVQPSSLAGYSLPAIDEGKVSLIVTDTDDTATTLRACVDFTISDAGIQELQTRGRKVRPDVRLDWTVIGGDDISTGRRGQTSDVDAGIACSAEADIPVGEERLSRVSVDVEFSTYRRSILGMDFDSESLSRSRSDAEHLRSPFAGGPDFGTELDEPLFLDLDEVGEQRWTSDDLSSSYAALIGEDANAIAVYENRDKTYSAPPWLTDMSLVVSDSDEDSSTVRGCVAWELNSEAQALLRTKGRSATPEVNLSWASTASGYIDSYTFTDRGAETNEDNAAGVACSPPMEVDSEDLGNERRISVALNSKRTGRLTADHEQTVGNAFGTTAGNPPGREPRSGFFEQGL